MRIMIQERQINIAESDGIYFVVHAIRNCGIIDARHHLVCHPRLCRRHWFVRRRANQTTAATCGTSGLDSCLHLAYRSLHLRLQFLPPLESRIGLRRYRTANRRGRQDQLGRRSVHKLCFAHTLARRRRLVVARWHQFLSQAKLAVGNNMALIPDLYNFQRNGSF